MKTLIYTINHQNPDENIISKAVKILQKGGIISFGADTAYALSVDAMNSEAYEKLYSLKQRERSKPMTLFADSIGMIMKYVSGFDDKAIALSNAFLPGLLTLVFHANIKLPKYLASDNGKIAFRIPITLFGRKLIQSLGTPITGTSANISSMESARTKDEVLEYFDGKIDMIIDNGDCPMMKPSTLIDMTDACYPILRHGSIDEASIRAMLKK
jgi:L-threonylcarbamoyladenylate synthase